MGGMGSTYLLAVGGIYMILVTCMLTPSFVGGVAVDTIEREREGEREPTGVFSTREEESSPCIIRKFCCSDGGWESSACRFDSSERCAWCCWCSFLKFCARRAANHVSVACAVLQNTWYPYRVLSVDLCFFFFFLFLAET